MVTYEYRTIDSSLGPMTQKRLNELGAEGWRLIQILYHEASWLHYFVREKEPPMRMEFSTGARMI